MQNLEHFFHIFEFLDFFRKYLCLLFFNLLLGQQIHKNFNHTLANFFLIAYEKLLSQILSKFQIFLICHCGIPWIFFTKGAGSIFNKNMKRKLIIWKSHVFITHSNMYVHLILYGAQWKANIATIHFVCLNQICFLSCASFVFNRKNTLAVLS